MPTPAILYFYLDHSPFIPLNTANRAVIQELSKNRTIHDLDLHTDSLSWEYLQQWMQQQEHLILLVDGDLGISELNPDIKLLIKKSIARLLKYKSKISVAYLDSFRSTSFYTHCKALGKLPHTFIDSVSNVIELTPEHFQRE